MSRLRLASLAGLLVLSGACSSAATDPTTEASGGRGGDTGGSSASGGSRPIASAGATVDAGGSSSGSPSGNGGTNGGAAGSIAGGGALATGGGAGAGGVGGAHGGAPGAHGGAAGSAMGGGGTGAAGSGTGGGAGSSSCPGAGHITYTLAKSASPTATEQTAYGRIETAMDKAISYYDCYTSITKALNVSYVPSVSTADGNINGSVRFGSDTTYMDYRTAMHEIAHTVGIGQASNWGTFLSGGLFTGARAAAQLKAINAKLSTPLYTDVHADTQHFWPYGINQQSEVKSEADLIAHCQMVVAIRADLGL